jgi:energy-coupling factor transporter ATP-binding protein EcfA2
VNCTYVIGEPGAGKSTLVDHLTRAVPYEEAEQPFPHRRYEGGVLELGRRRHEFSGTDALAMNIQPEVARWVEGIHPRLLLAEGDRLGNAKFFDHLIAIGYNLRIYALLGARQAFIQRELRGSGQNDTWLKGRQTKVARLCAKYEDRVIVLPVGGRPSDLEKEFVDDPVVANLRAARELVTA